MTQPINNSSFVSFSSRLISNTFTINSAGISPATRLQEQRARAVQRRQNIAPLQVNFDLKYESPEKDANMGEDISFYGTSNTASSPRPCPVSPFRNEESLLSPGTSPSLFIINDEKLPRQDSSSMDSGYSGGQQLSQSSTSSSAFQFIEPKRPETSSSSSPPPTMKTPSKNSSLNLSSRMNFSIFQSISSSSTETMEDELMDLMDLESVDEDAQLPNDINSLICKDIKNKTPDHKRHDSYARKCLNMDAGFKNVLFSSPSTPKSSTINTLITTPERQCLQNIDNVTPFGHRNTSTGGFKRPEPPTMSPIHSKRYKCENDPPATAGIMQLTQPQFPSKRPVLRKSMSMNDAVIMDALSRSSSESNLIGDFSRPFCLPLVEGRHANLKSISCDTMRQLLSGEFKDSVAFYKIVDCRYPYEYEGGHIIGAINLYTQDQILDELIRKNNQPMSSEGSKRNILIFHCEFSSERGPRL